MYFGRMISIVVKKKQSIDELKTTNVDGNIVKTAKESIAKDNTPIYLSILIILKAAIHWLHKNKIRKTSPTIP